MEKCGVTASELEAAHLTEFRQQVYNTLCAVPSGCVTTYNAISKHLGASPRAVGQALKNNPFAPRVPCHRVIKGNLTIGGFAGCVGMETEKIQKKIRMLEEEGLFFSAAGKLKGVCQRAVMLDFPAEKEE